MKARKQNNLTPLIIITLIAIFIFGMVIVLNNAGFRSKLPTSYQGDVIDDGSARVPTATSVPVIDKANNFEVENAKVGDIVGPMKITQISGYKSEKATNDSAFVNFSGKVTLRGDVIYAKPSTYAGEAVCMEKLDEHSQAQLPKLTSQYYVELSFCFSNINLAKKLLVKDPDSDKQGRATVTIDNYKIQWFPVSITNMADIISVQKAI